MDGKRRSIKQKVQAIVLLIAIFSLIVTSAVSIVSMVHIKNDSETALTRQMELNLNNIVTCKADFANLKFGKYADYISNFADYTNKLYKNPNDYIKKRVLAPDKNNYDKFSMQRTFSSKDISFENINDELSLLGNLEQIWSPIITANDDVITSIYLGTESGFMISYDKYPEIDEGESESYYNYFESSWYNGAKAAGEVYFTDVYDDSYGRGLMISCAAPFYNANEEFAGVVCMDMLISDLHRAVVSLDLAEESHIFLTNTYENILEECAQVFLIDTHGNIITGSDEYAENEGFENIYINTDIDDSLANDIMAGKTGLALSDNGTYYAYTPIAGISWRLCITVPQAVILQPVQAMNVGIIKTIVLFLIFFIIVILLVMLITEKFSKHLTDPLISLGKDVSAISGGDLDYRSKIYNNDEIGDLARGFNDMASSLKKYINDFKAVTAEKERIGAELNVASQIQSGILPNVFPAFPDRKEFDIYATMTPAKEVGGDFYDFFFIDENHLAMVMADVSGKGVPAALFMMASRILLNDRAMIGGTPSEIFEFVNDRLCASNLADMFVTVWFGILDIQTGIVTAANAGHEYPAITNANGEFELYKDKHGFVLGGMEGMLYKNYTFTLNKGCCLYLYTDGVAEATNAENKLFGTERMIKALNKEADRTPENILKRVKSDIDDFVKDAPQFDDITMLCIKYNGKED